MKSYYELSVGSKDEKLDVDVELSLDEINSIINSKEYKLGLDIDESHSIREKYKFDIDEKDIEMVKAFIIRVKEIVKGIGHTN